MREKKKKEKGEQRKGVLQHRLSEFYNLPEMFFNVLRAHLVQELSEVTTGGTIFFRVCLCRPGKPALNTHIARHKTDRATDIYIF